MAEPAFGAAAPAQDLADRYREAFRAWLEHRDERELGTAYALGREAVTAQLSVLELAEAHHEAAAGVLRDEHDPERRAELLQAAGTFFGEALSTFEIAHRGYREVQELARLEHEHAMQLRALAEASMRIKRALDDGGGAAAHRRRRAAGAGRPRRGDRPHGSQRGRRDPRPPAQRRRAARRARGERRARARVHAARRGETRPSAVLGLLHRALCELPDDGRFCTVAYGTFEPRGGGVRMLLACGGHPLPLVLRRSGAVEPVGRRGTLLGTDVEPVLRDAAVDLAPGDFVVLYTDGMTEVRAGRREIFGHRDLAALLGACAGRSAEEIAQCVQEAVLEAAGGRPRDDIAVLVAGPDQPPDAADPGTLPGAPRPTEATDGRT